MTPVALSLDVLVAIALSAAAALWLVLRAVRAWRRKAGGCGCASSADAGCPAAKGMADDLRRAAARAAARPRGR